MLWCAAIHFYKTHLGPQSLHNPSLILHWLILIDYELYVLFYFNLYDFLITWLFYGLLIIILKFINLKKKKKKKGAVHFNQVHTFALHLAPRLQEAFALKCAQHFYQHWFHLCARPRHCCDCYAIGNGDPEQSPLPRLRGNGCIQLC